MPRFHGIPFHDSSPNHNVINERVCFRRQKLFTRSHGNRHPLAFGFPLQHDHQPAGLLSITRNENGRALPNRHLLRGISSFHGKGIYLQLAVPYTYNTVLIPSTDLEEVVVKSTISKYSNGKNGSEYSCRFRPDKVTPQCHPVAHRHTETHPLLQWKWFRRTRSTHEQLQCRRGKF